MSRIIDFFRRGLNAVRRFWLNRLARRIQKLLDSIGTELLDELLELLLRAVRLSLLIDSDFRRNIDGFNARYTFRSERGEIDASAVFANNRMKVKQKALEDADVTVVFRDGKAMWEFLTSGSPDIFAFVLDNKLRWEGNLNYLLKFAYMAQHLRASLTP